MSFDLLVYGMMLIALGFAALIALIVLIYLGRIMLESVQGFVYRLNASKKQGSGKETSQRYNPDHVRAIAQDVTGGRSDTVSATRIADWAEQEKEKNKTAQVTSKAEALKACSGVVIWGITRFTDSITKVASRSTESKDIAAKVNSSMAKRFTGDATVFEIGCYTFVMIDYLCRQQNREDIGDLLPYCMRDFVTVCEQVGKFPNAGDIFDQRLEYYGAIIRAGQFENLPKRVANLILLTENQGTPTRFEGDAPPIFVGDIFVATSLISLIVSFDHVLTGILKACANTVRFLDRF